MKKILGLFMLMSLACNMLAEDVIYPSVTASPLSRKGNNYYYNGEKISQRDCQAYLLCNAAEDIYNQFRKGRQMYSTGWGLLGTGLALDAFALGFTLGICLPFNQNLEAPTMGPMLAVMLVSLPVAAGGLAFTITGIPLVCVGQKKMKKSFEAYNISLSSTHIQPELRLQANNNGIGLVCSF